MDVQPANEAALQSVNEILSRARAEVAKVIIGQQRVVDFCLIAVFTGNHILIEGVPGVAKTLLVRTLAKVLGADFSRIQFTPDLMPSDITGTSVFNLQEGAFHLVKGPIFTSFLLADEINRAPAKTQSALLQAMQEHHVTVAGQRHDLPRPFHVLATQNPIEQEGTYPLPEAQLDRFLLQIDVPYPSLDAERRMLFATTGAAEEQAEKVLSTTELLNAQRLTRLIPVGEQVADAILRVVRAARPGPEADDFVNRNVAWGPSPRASQALMLGARARAMLQGRLSPSLEDVAALMGPVFRHRMALNFTARADGHTIDGAIERLSKLIA